MSRNIGRSAELSAARLDAAPDRLDAPTRILALAAALVCAWLYLGRLDRLLLQRGNEAMYATPSIHMLSSGDYLMPRWQNQDFLDKPPLTFWIVAASYRLFGIDLFAENLPAALAGLATAAILGYWVYRRSGVRAGLLAGLILSLFPLFLTVSLTFAADAFLTLALVIATFALDGAARRRDGTDLRWGVLCGAALAFSFYCKGLIGVVLPGAAVAAGLALDRTWPVHPVRRAVWGLAVLGVLIAPWHWVMAQRLGSEFWRLFYWENQFLRGSTRIFMAPSRGALYYVGILAWGAFPWSLHLPGTLLRRRPSSVFLGWFAFGLVFWSLLVMKREVYLVTVLPAAAALVAEALAGTPPRSTLWRRVPWILGAAGAGAVLMVLVRVFPRLVEVSGSSSATAFLGAALAILTAALVGAVIAPGNSRAPFGVALACGVFLLSLQAFEGRLDRFDPLPEWGERVRRECAEGCDGFLVGNNYNSIDFYSRYDWLPVPEGLSGVPGRLRHSRGFVLMWTADEPDLAKLPLKAEVLDRRPVIRRRIVETLLGRGEGGIESLSLVRVERER